MCNLHFKTMMKHQTYPHWGTFYKINGLYFSKMVTPRITKNLQPFWIKMSKNTTFMILNFLLLFRILSEQWITPLYKVCGLFQCYFILKTVLWICRFPRLHSGKEPACQCGQRMPYSVTYVLQLPCFSLSLDKGNTVIGIPSVMCTITIMEI